MIRKPGCEGRKTLVFDMDETLVHSNNRENMFYDRKITFTLSNKEVSEVCINIRPHAEEMLRNLSSKF